MNKEPTEKEQAEKSSEKEQTGKSSKFGGIDDAMKAASEELFEGQDTKGEEEVAEEKETCEECVATEEDLKVEEEEAEPTLFLLDKDGNKTPLIGKADGKTYAPDSVEKAQTWLNLGIHANDRLEEVKKREAKLNEAEPFIKMIQDAFKKGDLVIKGQEGKQEGQEKKAEETEEEEEGYVDPEVKALRDKVKKLEEKQNKSEEETKKDKERQFTEQVKQWKGEFDNQIKTLKKEKYFAAYTKLDDEDEDYPLEVYDLAAALDDEGNPKYDSLETVMKMSHESTLKFVKAFIKANPDVLKDEKVKIIGEHYKEKEEDEIAPVGAPGDLPASTGKKPEKKKYSGMDEALSAANVWLKGRKEAGQKF